LPNTTVVGNVDLDTLPAGWLVRRNQPYRWWYEAHEYFPEVPELQDRLWIKKFWLTVEKRLVPRLKMVSTVSESVADHFRSLYPNLDVVVARNFPLLRQHNPLQPEEPRFLLYQGDLNEGRGLELAILAIEKFNDLHLYVAGDGYLRPRLEKLIGESSAANRIQLLGRILPQDLKAITDKAWVGLNLLENKGLNYYYSLANKYGDYLQAGLPQINMDFPEYRLLNQPQVSELLEEYSVSALEKAITRLMNEDHYLKLRANAVLKRVNCCWELEAANLIRWFEAKVG
jgi:glycosyltransferase involved in cell wall biosynthesis